MSMKVEIGQKLVITSDQHQFILCEKKIVKSGANAGNTALIPVGYYPKLSHLINALIQKGIRDSDISSLKEMNSEIERVALLCSDAFEVRP